jgi:hypothetical protein
MVPAAVPMVATALALVAGAVSIHLIAVNGETRTQRRIAFLGLSAAFFTLSRTLVANAAVTFGGIDFYTAFRTEWWYFWLTLGLPVVFSCGAVGTLIILHRQNGGLDR